MLPAVSARRIWVDTDPALGMFGRDADDALALVQLWGTPGVEVVGISASYGNAAVKDTYRIAGEMVKRWGRSGVTLHRGAVAAGDADGAGVAACARALEEGPLIYLALAPLTHLAAVLSARPDLVARIEEVVFVGGRTPGERFLFGWCLYEFHDANVEKDAGAVRCVLERGVSLTLVSMERAREALLPQAAFREAIGDGVESQWLEFRTRHWFWLWRWCAGLKGSPVFDSLAVLAALEPQWVEFEERSLRLETFRGQPALHAVQESGGRRGRFVTSIRKGAVEGMLGRIKQAAVADGSRKTTGT